MGDLDDIVAERADGGIELTQVKFTVDPDRYMLDWDWLLARKPKGSSLLRKWSSSIERARQSGPICCALLRPNRRPDDARSGSLRDGRV